MIKIDACSLIYISKINLWSLTKDIYGDLIITPEIYEEVIKEGKRRSKPDAFIIEKKLHEKELEIHQRKGKLPEFNLGKGESEIIKEALEEKVHALIDDKKARLIGSKLGLNVKNIPLVMIEGLLKKKITKPVFNNYLNKWILVSSPSNEQILFIKQIRDMI